MEEKEEDRLRLGVVLVTTNREAFFDMKAWKDTIAEVSIAYLAITYVS